MKKYLFILGMLAALSATAQTAKETDAIKSLCGCYDVDFKYAETFAGSKDYQYAKPYHVGGLEYIVPIEVSPKKIMIQHLLVVEDSMVIKHWREDWEYEKKDLWLFTKDATWQKIPAQNNKGAWTQTVWEVDDAPRYQGISKWIDNDGKYYWENTTDAPLPRREYTKRNDYNVVKRTNRIYHTDSGWMHEQDNDKLIRTNGAKDVLLAQEKGYNNYIKTDDKQCAFAKYWWEKNKDFWVVVRQVWTDEMKDKRELHVLPEVDKEKLYDKLDEVQDMKLSGAALQAKVKETVEMYMGKNNTALSTIETQKR